MTLVGVVQSHVAPTPRKTGFFGFSEEWKLWAPLSADFHEIWPEHTSFNSADGFLLLFSKKSQVASFLNF